MDSEEQKPCWHLTNPTLSQQANLREIRKKIVDSCCRADQTSASDIQAVVQDEDVGSMTLCHDSDEELSNSIVNASLMSVDDDAPTSVETINRKEIDYSNFGRPYVPFSVEEVSLVRTLSMWSNHNVRVVGVASPVNNLNYNLWSLVSIGEEGGPFSIIVDMRLVSFPSKDCPIQVFGEIQMSEKNPSPMILAKFFRDFSSVDIFYYNKAVEELKKYIPHFVDKGNSQMRILDDSDSDM